MAYPCPHCGRMIEARAVSPGRFKKMQTFEMSRRWEPSHSVPALPAQSEPRVDFAEAVRQSPARPATVESDFLVVALQAIGCGVAACLLSVGLTFGLDWPWWVPVVTLGGTMSLAWFVLLTDQRRLLRVVEKIVGRDIDGDGAVGVPERPAISIEVTDPENRQIAYDVLPANEEMLRDVALAVFSKDCPFSRRELARTTNLSEDEIIGLQTSMRQHGYARYKGGKPNAGTELTKKGEALLRHFL
jgi:hypothetical protein